MKAFIDIETGGFSITKSAVCEIAMVVTDDLCNPISQFQHYIKPYHQENGDWVVYDEKAMKVNGLSIDFLSENGLFVNDVIQMFFNHINQMHDVTIIGHNSINFDVPRLNYLIRQFHCNNYRGLETCQQEDTMAISKKLYNCDSYSLENLCSEFGIINENAHSGLSDCYATIELYKKIKGL